MAFIDFPSDPAAYDIICKISNGSPSFAVVYKARCLASDTIVAIKIVNRAPTASQLRDLTNITRSTQNPPPPNILKPHCFFIFEDKLWVVMPYIACGSLQAIMNSRHPHGLSPDCIKVILIHVIAALDKFHSSGYAHRGVKPGNILLDRDGTVKLSDFGVSSWNYENEWLCSLGNTDIQPYWMPPEVWELRVGFGTVSDIWCLGVTALELFHGRPPFTAFPESISLQTDVLRRFHYSEHYKKGKGPMYRNCPRRMLSVIVKCINGLHPAARPSAENLLNHMFFSKDLPKSHKRFLVEEIVDSVLSDEAEYWAGVVKCRLVNEPNAVAEESGSGRTFKGWTFSTKSLEMEPILQGDGVSIGGCRSTDRDKRVRLCDESLEEDGGGVGESASS